MENHDSLEERLNGASVEDSRQLVEEFISAFFTDTSQDGAIERAPSADDNPELEK
jgi:hypothetical protein